MKKCIILISLLFIMLPLAYPRIFIDIEWYHVDSLLKVLPDQQDIERIQTLNRISASLSFEDAVKSKYYADEAMDLAGKLNYTEGVADANRNYGRVHFYEGNYPDALNFFYEAMHQYEELFILKKVAAMHMEIATTHFFANNIDKAIEIITKQVIPGYRDKDDMGNQVGDIYDTLRTLSKLGLPYRMTGRSDAALRIYQRYMEVGRKHGFDITDMMVHESLIAGCFIEIGNADSAIYHYRKTLKYPEINQSVPALKHEFKRRLASIYTANGEPDSAFFYYNNAYEWLEENGYLRSAFLAAWELGVFHAKYGRMPETEQSWLQAAALVEEMIDKRSFYRYDSLKYTVSFGMELFFPFSKKMVKETIYRYATWVYLDLFRQYQKNNNLRPAMHHLLAYTAAKDSLDRLTRNREAVEIQTRFETKRKDAEISALSQANEIKELRLMQFTWFILGLAGFSVFVVLLGLILYRQNDLKKSRHNLLLEQRLLRSQMNPHFIFNSLASVQNFIVKQDDTKASIYLSRFSELVRSILNNSIEEQITLEQEISTIENYLELQKVRFPEKFDFQLFVDDRLDTENTFIPPMLAQPFIENSIEHGIKHKTEKGHISVRFEQRNGGLELIIEDDGIGREKSAELRRQFNKDHKSLATSITQERIKVLNRKLRHKITMEIIDLKDENGEARGTRVVFGMPV